MDLTEELVKFVAMEVNGTTKTEFGGVEIDLGKWTKLSMAEAIARFQPDWFEPRIRVEDVKGPHFIQVLRTIVTTPPVSDLLAEQFGLIIRLGEDPEQPSNSEPTEGGRIADALARINRLLSRGAGDPGVVRLMEIFRELEKVNPLRRAIDMVDDGEAVGKAIAHVFEALAEEHLIQPTIIYDFPLAVSPLSKQKPDEPDWVERFEFYIGGFEVGNAFSELNDPDDQRARFEAQLKERERGDDEAMAMDEDYIRALGYGLPPTAGEGIGIDRLTMILTGSKSIRDVILFPLLRPQTKPPE